MDKSISTYTRNFADDPEKTIVFGLTGTGYFDLKAYEQYNNGTMTDVIPTDEEIAANLALLPKVE